MKYLLFLIGTLLINTCNAQTTIVFRNGTGKIVYVGSPPWAGQDTVTNVSHVFFNGKIPVDATDYFFKDGSFLYDSSDSTDAEVSFAPIYAAFAAYEGKTFSQLTATQKTNMIEAMMWRLGIINRKRKIKSVEQWLTKQ